jgi:hypothetical protein
MSHNNVFIICVLLLLFTFSCAAVASAQSANATEPSQVQLGDIKGAVVTLYYYDFATGGKGAMVPLPDNPQNVQWDYTKAAPGTYTYTHVPEGIYYLEAVHNNHSWFAIVTVNSTLGTSTANVAIPPYNDSGFFPSPSPTAAPAVAPTETPVVSPEPTPMPHATPSPGMTTLCALTGLAIVALYVVSRRE